MRLSKLSAALWLALSSGLGPATANAASVQDLHWLSGCWAAQGEEPGSGEQWTSPAGGTLLATSRTVKSGKTAAYEFLQIRETEAGKLVFIARPSGQAEASFDLVNIDATQVVFENLQHDFPQRISYFRGKHGGLHARIQGTQNGKLEVVDFPMQRTPCSTATGGS